MKYLKYVLLALVVAITTLFIPTHINVDAASAASLTAEQLRVKVLSNMTSFVDHGSSENYMVDRRAGTDGEFIAALWLRNKLSILGLEPKNNNSTVSGIQEFEFYNTHTNKKESSQNVIFTIKGSNSDKKVVISANYDNYYSGYLSQNDQIVTSGEKFSEGINASAGSVAVLLTMAEIISAGELAFDIDLVFYGSSYSNNAGAEYYSQTLNKDEREKILQIIDISNIAVGKELYYYTGEFATNQDAFIAETTSMIQFKNSFSGMPVTAETDIGYTTAGYSGAVTYLANSGLNIMHMFAGDYSSGVFSGTREHEGKQNVINTEDDSIDNIANLYGANWTTLIGAANSVYKLITNAKYVTEMSKSNNKIDYTQFVNLPNWVLLVVVAVLLIISFVVHYAISKRTLDYAQNNKISGVMITIEDPDDDNKEE